ncbi:MAG: hypothetical protein ABR589_06960 [Chthoniobacterales bacterium]
MKSFVLNLGGYETPRMSATEVSVLFHRGAIERTTPCRRRRASIWSTVDDIFPMLKYEVRQAGVCLAQSAGPMRRSAERLNATATFSDLLHFLGSKP